MNNWVLMCGNFKSFLGIMHDYFTYKSTIPLILANNLSILIPSRLKYKTNQQRLCLSYAFLQIIWVTSNYPNIEFLLTWLKLARNKTTSMPWGFLWVVPHLSGIKKNHFSHTYIVVPLIYIWWVLSFYVK